MSDSPKHREASSAVPMRAGRNGGKLNSGVPPEKRHMGGPYPAVGKKEAFLAVAEKARTGSLRAMERLLELMESDDERIALAASLAVLDRGIGRVKEVVQVDAKATVTEVRRVIVESMRTQTVTMDPAE